MTAPEAETADGKQCKKNRYGSWLLHAIGPCILLFLIWRVDFTQSLKLLASVKLGYLAAALFLLVPMLVLRSLRWRGLVGVQGVTLAWADAVWVYAFSILVGTATPGRLGEFIKVAFLRRGGMSLGASFFSVLMDRLFDLGFLLLFAAAAVLGLLGLQAIPLASGVVLLALLAGFGTWFFTIGKGQRLVPGLIGRLPGTTLKRRLGENYAGFSHGFARLRPKAILAAVTVTTFIWIINYLAIYLLALGIDLQVGFIYLSGLSAVASLVTLIPVSVMGVGTRDAALVFLLGLRGIPETQALALSVGMFLLLTANAALCALTLLHPQSRALFHVVRDQKNFLGLSGQ